jgi:hypothetical protein
MDGGLTMPMQTITVTQVYRVKRKITIEVEAVDQQVARDLVMSCEVDLPKWDDGRWLQSAWEILSEDVE